MFKTEDYFGLKKKGNYETSGIALTNLVEARKKSYKKHDNMHYLKQIQKLHEFHETKAKNVNFRRNLLNKQKAANYKNELDRVKGEIAKSIMKNVTHDQLIKRKDELGEMIKNIN